MWHEQDGKFYKRFEFSDFAQAFDFMTKVAIIAEQMKHHPTWTNEYNVVEVWLFTHSDNAITGKDHKLADAIDGISRVSYDDKNEVLPSIDVKNTTESKDINIEKAPEKVNLYTDGGSRGNPGPSAIGYVLLDQNDQTILKDSKYLGVTTNNQAEYLGLKTGLQKCLDMKIKVVNVHMDSLLVINQMKGLYKVKSIDLLPVYQSVRDLQAKFEKVTFTHVPRELNKIADSMVNECLDAQ